MRIDLFLCCDVGLKLCADTVCYVSFGQSIASSTRVANLYSFVACLSGIGAGILVRKIRRMKYMMFFGVCLFAVGFGLVIRYRGGPAEFAGMVGGQVRRHPSEK